jgi:hypothetical protein
MPRLHVYKDTDLVQTFLLSDASFIAVTAYQNEMVIDIFIKISTKIYLFLYIFSFLFFFVNKDGQTQNKA